MDGRKRSSGAEYRRSAKEKAERVEEVLAKTPKLNKFFKPKSCVSELGTDVPSSSSAHESMEVEGRYLNFLPFSPL